MFQQIYVIVSSFQPSIIFTSKIGTLQGGAPYDVELNLQMSKQLRSPPVNTRLGWKYLQVTNGLAYCRSVNDGA